MRALADAVEVLAANREADLEAIVALCKKYRLRGFGAVERELAAH